MSHSEENICQSGKGREHTHPPFHGALHYPLPLPVRFSSLKKCIPLFSQHPSRERKSFEAPIANGSTESSTSNHVFFSFSSYSYSRVKKCKKKATEAT
jgi:hypothetical protein